MTKANLAEVRRRLDDLRRRTGVKAGDEFDLILNSVESLAVTIDAMSLNAASLVEEGQRSVGAIVSAAMTRATIWRLAVLPAIVGALVSATIFGFTTTTQSIVAQRVIQADHDLMSAESVAERSDRDQHFEALRAELERERVGVAAERQRVESVLPGELLKRAETLPGAAREILRQEAATPGIIDFVARWGPFAAHAAQANGGGLCPETFYRGSTLYCAFKSP